MYSLCLYLIPRLIILLFVVVDKNKITKHYYIFLSNLYVAYIPNLILSIVNYKFLCIIKNFTLNAILILLHFINSIISAFIRKHIDVNLRFSFFEIQGIQIVFFLQSYFFSHYTPNWFKNCVQYK